MSEKDKKHISRFEITDIYEDWIKVKNFIGVNSDSEAMRSLIKKIARMIDRKELPP